MSFRERSIVDEREEFAKLALKPGANITELCKRFEIVRSNGYKWIKRYKTEGRDGLADRSRRPHSSPNRTSDAVEDRVLRVRAESNNVWCGRKIKRVLQNEGVRNPPAASTITEILRRRGKLDPIESKSRGPFQRFERKEPNELWQMDFKGHFPTRSVRCHPLTIIDDHSRYSVALKACANEQATTVRETLIVAFRRYGMPFAMLMDNGSPWGGESTLTIWLTRLDVRVCHGRPYHPQTQGKDERFHRTLDIEVLRSRDFADVSECQRAFDRWRHTYNHRRPHDALELATPATRYRPSERSFPEVLPEIEYWPGDHVRKVDSDGFIAFKSRSYRIGKPYRGEHVALRPTPRDGQLDVYFCARQIGVIDLTASSACGLMDIETRCPQDPQAPQQQQV
jgi:transposase InsO family protein